MTSRRKYTFSELLELLNSTDECNWLEAKGREDVQWHSGKANFRTLLESVCSFSNEPGLGGGVILYGVGENRAGNDENRYAVEGIDDIDKADPGTAVRESGINRNHDVLTGFRQQENGGSGG